MGHGGIQSGLVLCDFLSAGGLAVSLFGQELGTADKVSAKRLEEVGKAGLHPLRWARSGYLKNWSGGRDDRVKNTILRSRAILFRLRPQLMKARFNLLWQCAAAP